MPAIKSNPVRGSLNSMRDMILSSATPLFTSSLTKRPVPMKPHGDSLVEPDGSILFFVDGCVLSRVDGRTHRAQLFYANGRETSYLSVTGNVELVNDPDTIRGCRNRQTVAGAIADTDVLVKVTPVTAFCWNTRTGELVPLIKPAG
ncbi:MAG: hypothetical protein EOO05_18695 [Chitinophagaceae bacterium]|nr:MAG: hypothetical protein EOO05_18695 [Chitinophagaceae bacterium]